MLSLDIFARWAILSNVVAWKPNSTKSSRAASTIVWPSASLAGRPRRPWLFSVTTIPVLDSILVLALRYHEVSEMCKPMRRFQFVLQIKLPRPPGVIECGIVPPAKTVMGDFLVDAEALIAAGRKRVSSDDIAPTKTHGDFHATTSPAEVGCAFHHRPRPRSGHRQAQPVSLHPQHGAHHHG